MLFVEMSSCTRKMYGGGVKEQLRKKTAILAGLRARGAPQSEINTVEKEVARYTQAIANKEGHIQGLYQLGLQAEANAQAAKLASLKSSVVTAAQQAAINSASFPGNISSKFTALANQASRINQANSISQATGGKRRTRRRRTHRRRTHRRRN